MNKTQLKLHRIKALLEKMNQACFRTYFGNDSLGIVLEFLTVIGQEYVPQLNKKICKRCVDEIYQEEGKWKGYHWGEYEDMEWELGRVCCEVSPKGGKVQIEDEVPDWCPYVLEQRMSMQDG